VKVTGSRSFLSAPIIAGLLTLGALSARGQGFPTGPRGLGSGGSGSGSSKGPVQLEKIELDTFPVARFYALDPERAQRLTDTLLDASFHQYDPVRQQCFDYKNLGVPGSAHQALVYSPRLRRGFDVGLHAYDLYIRPAEALAFYRLERPLTNLEFSRGADQSNSNFSAQFSRNFSENLNFSIDYRRLASLGSAALFPNQQGRNTSIGTGFWTQSKSKRYQAFMIYADNKMEHNDNGGISEAPSREGAFFTPSAASVYLKDAGTRYRQQELLYVHYYKPGKKDSTSSKVPRQQIQLGHQMGYRGSTYKFFDASPAADASFYGVFQTDNRGVRHFIQHNKLENQFQILLRKNIPNAASGSALHLTHVLHRLRQEPGDSVFQEVFAGGKWHLSPFEALQLEVNAQLGLLGSAGDYQLQGHLKLELGRWGTFSGSVLSQLYRPTAVQNHFFVTQQPVWQNDFQKTLESSLQGGLQVHKWQLSAHAAYHVIGQGIFFDTSGRVFQSEPVQSVAQLSLQKNLMFWKLHLENQLVFQVTTGQYLRVPTWYGKHSLYFSGHLFKVMETRIGFDIRYTSAYYADAYFPLSGQFHLQNDVLLPFYPAIDAYFDMRVTRFRAFVKVEHIGDALYQNALYYWVPDYPRPPVSGFRLGIKWRLSE